MACIGKTTKIAVIPRRWRQWANQFKTCENPSSISDQDQRAVLGDAQGRARHQPLSDALCRRRTAGNQYRPDAGPGHDVRSGPALEEGTGRQGATWLTRASSF